MSMSHPIPGHDYSERHNEESEAEYNLRKKAALHTAKKKKVVASKMSAVDRLKKLIGESAALRNHPFGKGGNTPKWFKSGQGGSGELPPGRRDNENE